MAWGARKADRVRLENKYPVNLMGVDGTWRRSCVLVDVSVTGARLEVDGSLKSSRLRNFSSFYRPRAWRSGDVSWSGSTDPKSASDSLWTRKPKDAPLFPSE